MHCSNVAMTEAQLLLIASFAVILYLTTKKDKDVKDIRGVEEELGRSSWSFCRGCETGCELCTTHGQGLYNRRRDPGATKKHTACIGGELNKKFTRDEVFGDEATTEFATLMHQQQKTDMFATNHLSEIASFPLSVKKPPPLLPGPYLTDAERNQLPPKPPPPVYPGYVQPLDPNALKRPPPPSPAKPTAAKSVGGTNEISGNIPWPRFSVGGSSGSNQAPTTSNVPLNYPTPMIPPPWDIPTQPPPPQKTAPARPPQRILREGDRGHDGLIIKSPPIAALFDTKEANSYTYPGTHPGCCIPKTPPTIPWQPTLILPTETFTPPNLWLGAALNEPAESTSDPSASVMNSLDSSNVLSWDPTSSGTNTLTGTLTPYSGWVQTPTPESATNLTEEPLSAEHTPTPQTPSDTTQLVPTSGESQSAEPLRYSLEEHASDAYTDW